MWWKSQCSTYLGVYEWEFNRDRCIPNPRCLGFGYKSKSGPRKMDRELKSHFPGSEPPLGRSPSFCGGSNESVESRELLGTEFPYILKEETSWSSFSGCCQRFYLFTLSRPHPLNHPRPLFVGAKLDKLDSKMSSKVNIKRGLSKTLRDNSNQRTEIRRNSRSHGNSLSDK